MMNILRRKRNRLTWLVLCMGASLVYAPGHCQSQPPPRAATSSGPRLVHLAPGASVKERAPTGWTYRVIRSIPRLASGDLSTLPKSASTTATLFRTVLAVQVVRRDGLYELSRIGVGNAVPVGKQEIVVTRNGPEAALATLSFVDRMVLKEVEIELNRGRIVARTPTFALYRSPSYLAVGGKHVAVDLCYALLIDPTSGGLTTFTWAVPTGAHPPVSKIIELPQSATFDVALDVKVTKWLGPMPLAWSFAMSSLPPGRAVEVPSSAKRLVAEAGAGSDSTAVERALQTLAANAQAR